MIWVMSKRRCLRYLPDQKMTRLMMSCLSLQQRCLSCCFAMNQANLKMRCMTWNQKERWCTAEQSLDDESSESEAEEYDSDDMPRLRQQQDEDELSKVEEEAAIKKYWASRREIKIGQAWIHRHWKQARGLMAATRGSLGARIRQRE